MDNKDTENTQSKSEVEKKPNENAGFYFSGSIKITDPNTGEILVQMRAD